MFINLAFAAIFGVIVVVALVGAAANFDDVAYVVGLVDCNIDGFCCKCY